MLTHFALVMATAMAPPLPPQVPLVDCSYDVEAMLALDLTAFDQDLDGGWRPLSARGCNLEAAELIRDWRYQKRSHASILYWHEGQLRAFAGQTEQATALFALTYKPADLDADFGWNHYVDGSIAFLHRDKARLQVAIERLKAIPRPEGEPDTITMANGAVAKLSWPPNLKVLQAFERCWDRSYREAYGEPECHELTT